MDSQETVKRPTEETNGLSHHENGPGDEPAPKRVKLDTALDAAQKLSRVATKQPRPRAKGVAPIKQE